MPGKGEQFYKSSKKIAGASFSPDGSAIAFSEDGRLLLIRIADRKVAPLSKSAGTGFSPVFSRDGRLVYYVGPKDATGDVYCVDLKSDIVTRLTTSMNVCSAPAISPNGRLLAFSSSSGIEKPDEDSGNIWLLVLPNGKPQRLTTIGKDRFPAFSPDGTRIAFQRQEGKCHESPYPAYHVVVQSVTSLTNR